MTVQIGERPRYQGEDMTLATGPLEACFSLGGDRPSFGLVVSTALWRGHIGRWEIVDDRLYLVGVNAAAFRDEPRSRQRLFPGYGDRSSSPPTATAPSRLPRRPAR